MRVIIPSFFKTIPLAITGFILVASAGRSFAQAGTGNSNPLSDPFESQFFTNRYLANPAMAGLDSALHLNVAYRRQFAGFPGAPVTQAFTGDYNPGKRVGLGLIVYSDQAALISNTRFALTYAYHLPVGPSGQMLHFGVSGAFVHTQLDPKGIVGDQTDPVIADFNGRKSRFEADYGIGYTDVHLTLQGSITNLVDFFKPVNDNTADVSTFYMAMAYKFSFGGVVNSIEPQASLRGAPGHTSIADAGANIVLFNHILNIYGLYHSSGSFSTGFGLNYKDLLYIGGSYLSQVADLKNYTNGNYELDLGLSLFRRKK